MELVKKYWLIILIGLVLRLFIAAITYHPDVRIIDYSSAVILREGQLNPYEYAYSKREGAIKSDELPDDLPFQYLIHLPIDLVSRPFINVDTENTFLENASSLFGNLALNWHLLIIKLPLIISDLFLAIVLAYILPLGLRKQGLMFWLFNPVTLWATIGVGQVDIWPTFFVVMSILLFQKNKLSWAAFSLGLGGALKSFPFLILPFLILSSKTWIERIKLLLISIVPIALTVLPYLNSSDFRHYALFAPQLDKIFYSRINLSGGESVYLTVFILVFLYLFYLKTNRRINEFVAFSTTALLLVLALTHFHIQWFLWVTPMIIILILKRKSEPMLMSVSLLFLSWMSMLFLFESSLQVGLFSPLVPVLDRTPGLAEILAKTQAEFLRNMAATIFAAASVYFSLNILIRNEE